MINDILLLADKTEPSYEAVGKTVDLDEAFDGLLFQGAWEGLPEKCDFIWQLAHKLHINVADLVNFYLPFCKKSRSLPSLSPSLMSLRENSRLLYKKVLMGAVLQTGFKITFSTRLRTGTLTHTFDTTPDSKRKPWL